MKKAFLFFAAICMAAAMWADNVITYTATSQLEETLEQGQGGVGGLYIRGFNLPIQSHTFANGKGTITFSGEVTTIKPYTFYGCTKLTGITIPNSVTSIGEFAFENCYNITSVTWNARNCISDTKKPFQWSAWKISSVTFGPEVQVIPDSLCDNTTLASVAIPASVTHIGKGVFGSLSSVIWNARNCTTETHFRRLPAITFGSEVEVIPAHLCEHANLSTLTIPNSVRTIGACAFRGCQSLTSVVIGSGVQTLCDSAFLYCPYLASLTIQGNSLTTIGKRAFCDCYRIAAINLPNSVTTIETRAFDQCNAVTSLVIPESLKTVKKESFFQMTSLTTITWNAIDCSKPDDDEWNDGIFYMVHDHITNVYFGSKVQTIPANLFRDMPNLGLVTIPSSVRTIGERAFRGSGLPTLILTEGVQNIDDAAFSSCKNLTSVTIPNSVKTIGGWAFQSCSSLSSVTMGDGVETIGTDAFFGCNNLNSVTLSTSLTTIGETAFSMCDIHSLTLPASLQAIGAQAFSNNYSLAEIHSEATTPPTVGADAFKYVLRTIPVYIPASTKSAYESAQGWSYFSNFIDPAEQSDPAAIESLEATQPGTKTILNGQVVILRDGKTYNMLGKLIIN